MGKVAAANPFAPANPFVASATDPGGDGINAPGGAAYGFAPNPPNGADTAARSPVTVIDGLYLASSYAGFGGYNVLGRPYRGGHVGRKLRRTTNDSVASDQLWPALQNCTVINTTLC